MIFNTAGVVEYYSPQVMINPHIQRMGLQYLFTIWLKELNSATTKDLETKLLKINFLIKIYLKLLNKAASTKGGFSLTENFPRTRTDRKSFFFIWGKKDYKIVRLMQILSFFKICLFLSS